MLDEATFFAISVYSVPKPDGILGEDHCEYKARRDGGIGVGILLNKLVSDHLRAAAVSLTS